MENFDGVKVALFIGEKLLVIQRDTGAHVRFAGLWEFPGGGREGNENPEACALREIKEELNLSLWPEQITYKREYPAMHDASLRAYFMVIHLDAEIKNKIKLGNEGRKWELWLPEAFLQSDQVVPGLKQRLVDFLNS